MPLFCCARPSGACPPAARRLQALLRGPARPGWVLCRSWVSLQVSEHPCARPTCSDSTPFARRSGRSEGSTGRPDGCFPPLDAGPQPAPLDAAPRPEYRALVLLRSPARTTRLTRGDTSPSWGLHHRASGCGWTPMSSTAWPLPGCVAARAGHGPRMTWPTWASARARNALTATGSPAVLVPLGAAAANGTARRRPLVPALQAGSPPPPEGAGYKPDGLQDEHGGGGSTHRDRASAPSGRHGCSGGFATGAAVRGGDVSPKSNPSGRTRATPMPSKQATSRQLRGRTTLPADHCG